MPLAPLFNCLSKRHTLYCLLLAGIGVGYFWPHLCGAGSFVGDSDRLGTYLNVRQYSIDGLQELGRVPTWNERMFCGFGTSGLHWMWPELDPLAYAEALLPRGALLRVSGYVSCLLLIFAALAMYALAFDVCRHAFCAFVSAVLYVSSSFSLTRISQVDWAYMVLIGLPLGLWIIRRITPAARAVHWYWSLAGLSAFLLLFTFLQEVAYALALFLAFAVYRGIVLRSWLPVIVGGAALYAGTVVALPRLYTVYEEFHLLQRTSTAPTTQPLELLRWFNDGIFGRHLGEAASLGNEVNLHEGLQLHSSALAAILIVTAAVRWRGRADIIAGSAFFVVLACIVASMGEYRAAFLAALAYLLLLGMVRRPAAEPEGGSDFTFHLASLTVCLAVILIPEVRSVFHLAFFRVDFSHSRLTIVALVSASVLTALALKRLFALDGAGNWRGFALGVLALPAAACLVWGMDLAARHVKEWLPLPWYDAECRMMMIPEEGAKALLALAAGGLIIALWSALRGRRLADLVPATTGWAMVLGAVAYASFQLHGSHTWTFPAAFTGHNRFMAPCGCLTPPTPEQRQAMRRLLESDEYRTAVVASPGHYGELAEPHLAEFWGIRLAGGYGAGVPGRLCGLPWPNDLRQLRAVSFSSERSIHWGLLSLLNTKYVALVDDAFFFNIDPSYPSAGLRPRIYENPLPVLPRQFFAKAIRCRDIKSETTQVEHAPITAMASRQANDDPPCFPAPALRATVHAANTVTLSWQFPDRSDIRFAIERAVGLDGQFLPAGEVSGRARGHVAIDLDPGMIYKYRLRARQGRRWCSDYSDAVTLVAPAAHVAAPAEVRANWISPGEALLCWRGTPGSRYAVEVLRPEQTAFEPYALTERGAHSVTIAGLGIGAYGFRLRAEREARWSAHSEEAWLMPTGPTDDGVSRRLKELFPADLRELSTVEGNLEADALDASGPLQACYEGDRITLEVAPSPQARFVVLNELYHPRWRAFADGQEVAVYPTNRFMRGVLLPPNTRQVELRFVPFVHTPLGRLLLVGGFIQALLIGWFCRERRARSVFSRSGLRQSDTP
jgi:hypothetical protein